MLYTINISIGMIQYLTTSDLDIISPQRCYSHSKLPSFSVTKQDLYKPQPFLPLCHSAPLSTVHYAEIRYIDCHTSRRVLSSRQRNHGNRQILFRSVHSPTHALIRTLLRLGIDHYSSRRCEERSSEYRYETKAFARDVGSTRNGKVSWVCTSSS